MALAALAMVGEQQREGGSHRGGEGIRSTKDDARRGIGGGVAGERIGEGWAGNAKCVFITRERVKETVSFF
jgi:hypothetical protein